MSLHRPAKEHLTVSRNTETQNHSLPLAKMFCFKKKNLWQNLFKLKNKPNLIKTCCLRIVSREDDVPVTLRLLMSQDILALHSNTTQIINTANNNKKASLFRNKNMEMLKQNDFVTMTINSGQQQPQRSHCLSQKLFSLRTESARNNRRDPGSLQAAESFSRPSSRVVWKNWETVNESLCKAGERQTGSSFHPKLHDRSRNSSPQSKRCNTPPSL